MSHMSAVTGTTAEARAEAFSAVDTHWTFLTNHAHVLLCLAADSGIRVRDVATRVGITERAAQRILRDLADAGYIESTRTGRRNAYGLSLDRPMRHPVESTRPVRALVESLGEPSS